MIKSQLRDYLRHVNEAKQISAEDVRDLQRRVLENGLTCKAEAEALLALDRTLPADRTWGDALCALMVDFVVWGSRPTGKITAEDAKWLAAVLEADTPTETAIRIAHLLVDEAEEVDEALMTLVRRWERSPHARAA
jgi:hypothetical protein